MGQRLTVEFRYNNRMIACLYQHWSAYTSSAIMTIYDLIGKTRWKVPKSKDQAILQALQMLKHIKGVCLVGDETERPKALKRFKKNIPEYAEIKKLLKLFDRDGNRNVGEIALGREAYSLNRYGEYSCRIDLDTQRIKFEVFSIYKKEKQYFCEMCDYFDLLQKPRKLLGVDISLTNFGYKDVKAVIAVIANVFRQTGTIQTKSDGILEEIE